MCVAIITMGRERESPNLLTPITLPPSQLLSQTCNGRRSDKTDPNFMIITARLTFPLFFFRFFLFFSRFKLYKCILTVRFASLINFSVKNLSMLSLTFTTKRQNVNLTSDLDLCPHDLQTYGETVTTHEGKTAHE